jgi:hypothetical protein
MALTPPAVDELELARRDDLVHEVAHLVGRIVIPALEEGLLDVCDGRGGEKCVGVCGE